MDEIVTPAARRPTPLHRTNDHRPGLVPDVANFAIEAVERTQTTAISIIQDMRGELRTTVDGALDLTEKAIGSILRIARKLTQRIDEATAETLTGVERVLSTATRGARDTTMAATDLARSTVDGAVGHRPSA